MLPDGRVSNKHAVISWQDGIFYIEDTSTNGVYLNHSGVRLIQGRPEPLNHGDHISIGPYEIRVVLGAAAPARRPPQASPDPFGLGASDPFAEMDSYALVDDYGPAAAAGHPLSPLPAEESQILDPLALLGGSAAQPPRPRDRVPIEPLHGQSPLADHYRPPPPPVPAAPAPGHGQVIPDDYDPLRPETGAFRHAPPVPRAAAPSEPPKVVAPPASGASSEHRASVQAMAGAPGSLRASDPFSSSASSADLRGARDRTGPVPSRVPSDLTPPPRPRLPRSPGSTGVGVTGVLPRPDGPRTGQRAVPQAANPLVDVLAGAGLPDAPIGDELGKDLGRILAVVVGGVMDVLRARQQIKDEFRMRVTQFRPADNNPLKFSANVEDALHNLLVKRNAAYLPAVEAFEDAFDDLRGHQLAMLAGMRVAFDALLRQFDATRLQEQFDRQVKRGALLAVPAKLRYWDMYREHVAALVADADGTFRRLFAEEFARAYEEQLAALRAAKHDGANRG